MSLFLYNHFLLSLFSVIHGRFFSASIYLPSHQVFLAVFVAYIDLGACTACIVFKIYPRPKPRSISSIMAAGPYYSSLLFNKVNPFADETDGHSRELQNVAFLTCLGLTLCLVWNSGSVAFLWMVGGVESKTLFLALFYLVCGLPAANWLWFRPLCRALRTENTSMFRCFFLFYQLHIAFCMFAAVSPPIIARGRSLTGILSASDIVGDYGEIGYLYFIGFAWFSLESVLSIWVLQKVYKFYRLGGLALEMV